MHQANSIDPRQRPAKGERASYRFCRVALEPICQRFFSRGANLRRPCGRSLAEEPSPCSKSACHRDQLGMLCDNITAAYISRGAKPSPARPSPSPNGHPLLAIFFESVTRAASKAYSKIVPEYVTSRGDMAVLHNQSLAGNRTSAVASPLRLGVNMKRSLSA
jgi:hypothetical protein